MRFAIAVLVILATAACTADPQVTINGEILRGKFIDEFGVSAFLGVPFAAPPTGELRWQGPAEYVSPGGVRDASTFAPACMQTPRIVDWYRDLAELFDNDRSVVDDLPVSEDCLYLNVWTPDTRTDADLPVMVYIHGGGNNSGWSWEPNYHGHALAAEGVVVVSIAYRVGDFGFFAHPDIDQGPAVANFGLWDQVAALEWVQENIASFGGDSDRVTAFGESAGASNIVSLMFSHSADKLFSQGILQSTGGFGLGATRTITDERERGAALARKIGGDRALSITEMRAIPADEFLTLSEQNLQDHYHAPVVDGTLLNELVTAKLKSGDYVPRSLIVGTNADEWYAYFPKDIDEEAVETRAGAIFPRSHQAALAEVRGEQDIRVRLDRIYTAAEFLCPSQYFASQVSTKENPAWLYLFNRAREGNAGKEWRAYHGVELPYVFGTHDDWMTVSDADDRVTATTMSYWLNFAKNGNPNSDETVRWPEFAIPGFEVQSINDPTVTIATPESVLCQIYRSERQPDQESER
jgi:para-nitrobenzyl esterase